MSANKAIRFFIVGAPKSATTSLAQWLGRRGGVFVTRPKEPHYFSSDFRIPHGVRDWSTYQGLFDAADRGVSAVGEASVFYLASTIAIPKIEAAYPKDDVRYIVSFRNPIQVASSLHSMFQVEGIEDDQSFESAWRKQSARQLGANLPRNCYEPRLLQYRTITQFGAQFKRLNSVVERSRILPIIFEDLVSNPERELPRIEQFLGIGASSSYVLPKVNENRSIRFAAIHRGLVQMSRLAVRAKAAIGWRGGLGILNAAQCSLTAKSTRGPLRRQFFEELAHEYEEDIQLLESLLDRKLSMWRKQ